jgi:hypothetical protein
VRINAVGSILFITTISYCNEMNAATFSVNSEVDMAFWLRLTVPVDLLNTILSESPTGKRSWRIRAEGRVPAHYDGSFRITSVVHTKWNLTRGRGIAASIRRGDEADSFEIEVRAGHAPKFACFIKFNANQFQTACSLKHPDSELDTIPITPLI